MANFDLLTFASNRTKRIASSGASIQFNEVEIGAASPIAIQWASATNLTFGSSVVLSNVSTPLLATDAANKAYVDSVVQGLDVKSSIRVATTTALPSYTHSAANTLTATVNGAFAAVDGVTLVVGDRILVKDETGGNIKYNGLYSLTQVGSGGTPWILVRTTDADNHVPNLVTAGMFAFVEEGTVNADSGWVLTTNAPIVLDTTNLTFTQFSGAGSFTAGNGITIAGSLVSVKLAVTNPGLQFSGGGVAVLADGLTITVTGAGVGVPASGITATQLAAASVDETKITTSVAGAGLVGGGGVALSVNVDSSTVEINADTLRVKALGITSNELATDSVTTAKIAADAVATAKILNANVTLAKLASLSVDENKLTTSVAGAGLVGGGGVALAVGAGTAISVAADTVSVDFTSLLTNNSGGTVSIGQIVTFSSVGGILALAVASDTTLPDAQLGIVISASILNGADGLVMVRRGGIAGSFSSLTEGKLYYVSRATPGAVVNTLAAFVVGDEVYAVGRAYSATEITYDPYFILEY